MTLADTKLQTERLAYNRTIGVTAMIGRGLYYPTDSVVGDDGRLYVLNRSLQPDIRGIRVTVMDIDEEYFGTFGTYGEGDGQFISPLSITIDGEQKVYISDDNLNRITVMSTSGEFILKWGAGGAGDGQMDGPCGVAVNSANEVLVVDHRNNRIQRFAADGEYLGKFGGAGADAGQFNLPWGIFVTSDDHILVADWGNDRVQKLTPDGEFVTAYGRPGRGDGEFHCPASVCLDEDGFIYVADWGNNRVVVLDPDGGFVQSLRGQATTSKWAQEWLDTNREEAGARTRANLDLTPDLFDGDPHEESSHIEKYFWGPSSVMLADDYLYVVDSSRHRVQVFDVLKSG